MIYLLSTEFIITTMFIVYILKLKKYSIIYIIINIGEYNLYRKNLFL